MGGGEYCVGEYKQISFNFAVTHWKCVEKVFLK